MRIPFLFSLVLATGLIVTITGCSDNKNKNVTVRDLKRVDSEPPPPQPPLVPPPGVKLENAVERCFTNDGLQYATMIKFRFTSATDITGTVESRNLESDKITTGPFTGTFSGNQFTAQFKGTPPVVGNSSEWMDKAWTVTDKKISIPFKAKNPDTNKWEEMSFEFDLADCK